MRRLKKKLHKISATIAAIFVGILFAFSPLTIAFVPSLAATTYLTDYDKTDIMEDLADVIDATEYPENPDGLPEIIVLQEYLYSEKIFYADYFGLYMYIYNPNEKPLATSNCFVSMAKSYDAEGKGKDFSNTKLKFLDKTENDRFYKFKIAGAEILKTAKGYAALHNGKRRYDFADITLNYADGTTLDTASLNRRFSKTYYFTGYAQGVSDESSVVSTLKSESEELETIVLNVKHANYRTGDVVDFVQDEINTVYFAVDEHYFEDYGSLQKIKSEWYEYKTRPIFVTSDSGAYAALSDWINVGIGTVNEELRWRVLWEENNFDSTVSGNYFKNRTFEKNYNGKMGKISSGFNENYALSPTTQAVARLDWLLESGEANTLEEYKISAEAVETYMSWYTTQFSTQKQLNGYAEGLFETSIDADRVALLDEPLDERGYVEQEIDASDEHGVLVETPQSWWDKIFDKHHYETQGIKPIVVLKESDLEGLTAEKFGEKYLISAEHRDECFDYVTETTANGQRAVLFRFAVTDYYASTARFDYENDEMSDPDGYVAQETVFLDFKVISLTFKNELEVETVIG
ncbi:MAG: hypothetical protein IJB97_00625, partial [Clostridia bacterium]|nr:hypothetical protein [Clostridia bacterium]